MDILSDVNITGLLKISRGIVSESGGEFDYLHVRNYLCLNGEEIYSFRDSVKCSVRTLGFSKHYEWDLSIPSSCTKFLIKNICGGAFPTVNVWKDDPSSTSSSLIQIDFCYDRSTNDLYGKLTNGFTESACVRFSITEKYGCGC